MTDGTPKKVTIAAGIKDAKDTKDGKEVEDPLANVREMEMLTISMPPDACIAKVTSSHVAIWEGSTYFTSCFDLLDRNLTVLPCVFRYVGGGNLLHENCVQFLGSLLEDSNIQDMLPEFKVARSNPQNCSRNLTITDVGNDGKVRIEEINLVKKSLIGEYQQECTSIMILFYSTTGSIPANLGSLEMLTILNVSFNELIGEIPESVGNLVNLKSDYPSYYYYAWMSLIIVFFFFV